MAATKFISTIFFTLLILISTISANVIMIKSANVTESNGISSEMRSLMFFRKNTTTSAADEKKLEKGENESKNELVLMDEESELIYFKQKNRGNVNKPRPRPMPKPPRTTRPNQRSQRINRRGKHRTPRKGSEKSKAKRRDWKNNAKNKHGDKDQPNRGRNPKGGVAQKGKKQGFQHDDFGGYGSGGKIVKDKNGRTVTKPNPGFKKGALPPGKEPQIPVRQAPDGTYQGGYVDMDTGRKRSGTFSFGGIMSSVGGLIGGKAGKDIAQDYENGEADVPGPDDDPEIYEPTFLRKKSSKAKSDSTMTYVGIGAGILVVCLIVGGGYTYMRKKKKGGSDSDSGSPTVVVGGRGKPKRMRMPRMLRRGRKGGKKRRPPAMSTMASTITQTEATTRSAVSTVAESTVEKSDITSAKEESKKKESKKKPSPKKESKKKEPKKPAESMMTTEATSAIESTAPKTTAKEESVKISKKKPSKKAKSKK